MATINMRVTGAQLAAMDGSRMGVYCTPGAREVYWASAPNFAFDVCVATVGDFLSAAGYDELDDSLMDEVFDLDVELARAR